MADTVTQTSDGGQYNMTIAGNTTTETAVHTGEGRFTQFNALTVGTGSFLVYDGTNSTTGTLIYISSTGAVLGDVKKTGIAFQTGLVVKMATNAPGINISFNKRSANKTNGN